MNYKKIFKDVLKDIKPRKTSLKPIEHFVEKLNTVLKKKKISAKAVVGGSYAKNTFLKGDHDVDVFVKFNYSKYAGSSLSDLLELALGDLKVKRVHGSRDYFHVKKHGYLFEIVPVLDLKKVHRAQNVTDYSPLHVDWVTRYIDGLHDEIRLAKKFCKAQKVYGAESYLQGFSGHVLDVLVIYYGGFLPLLQFASRWKGKEVIDFFEVYKGAALKEMNPSKLHSPLIVVDPVSPERNAASALGTEKFKLFQSAAKAFLEKPSASFFKEKKFSLANFKKRAGMKLVVSMSPLEGKQDVVGSKLLKSFVYIKKQLHEFEVVSWGWDWNGKGTAIGWYVLGKKNLPRFMEFQGPPTKIKANATAFKSKHKHVSLRKGRLYAKVSRTFIKPDTLVRNVLKRDYVKSRVTKCSLKYSGS